MVTVVAESVINVYVRELRRWGIDEISLVKAQGKFIVKLVDLETHNLLWLVSKTNNPPRKNYSERRQKVLDNIE
jgi:transposase